MKIDNYHHQFEDQFSTSPSIMTSSVETISERHSSFSQDDDEESIFVSSDDNSPSFRTSIHLFLFSFFFSVFSGDSLTNTYISKKLENLFIYLFWIIQIRMTLQLFPKRSLGGRSGVMLTESESMVILFINIYFYF